MLRRELLRTEAQSTEQEIVEKAEVEKQEIVDIFQQYGVTAEECAPIVTALVRKPEAWRDSGRALRVSAAITLLALAVFGFVKGHFTGVPKLKGALQTALVGSLAAGVAYLIAKCIA